MGFDLDHTLELFGWKRRRKQEPRPPTEKEEQFEKLWRGLTPRGVSRQKRKEFRSKMKSACLQLGYDFDKHNARLYFLGKLDLEDEDGMPKKGTEKTFKPPRRFLRNV